MISLTQHHDLEIDPDNPNVVCVNLTSDDKISISRPPKPVGYWGIEENFHISVYVVPSLWRRWWTRRLLGWKWVKDD